MKRQGTKTQTEREDEEAGRLIRPVPKDKPPRRDLRRNRIDTDPGEERDQDLSKNYKDVGGSVRISTFPAPQAMERSRVSVYVGIDPKENAPAPYPEWGQAHACDLGESDYRAILAAAKEWLRTPVLSDAVEGVTRDQQCRTALDLAIRSSKYDAAITANLYEDLLGRLSGRGTTANTSQRTVMKASTRLREFAQRAASMDAELAYDLLDLAHKVAAEEQEEKKPQEAEEDGDKAKEQKKEASASDYAELKSLIIRTASASPAAKEALRPLLQHIKDKTTPRS